MTTPVTVYSKPNCQACTATKRWLTQRSIPFIEEDITEPGNLAAAKALGHLEAPVVVYGDRHWSGFNPNELGLIERLAA
jgi:glutaredoxin-like protein NrdH